MNKKSQNTSKKDIRKYIDDLFAIDGVRTYSDTCTFFNLFVKSPIGSIAIYGCSVVTTADGEDFISWPSRQYTAADGSQKWANNASIILADGYQEKIIDAVAEIC